MNPRTASLWAPSGDARGLPSLTQNLAADVVVLGGGVSGLTTALRLAEAGKHVVLLEARTLASGVTSGTTAHITAAVDARYATIAKDFGKAGARIVAASSVEAIEHIATRVLQLGIDCDFVRLPGYLYTESANGRPELLEEYKAAREAGLDVELDVPLSLPFSTAGSVCFPEQARLHPLRYTDGLARAALAAGVKIYEHSRAVDLTDGEPCEVLLESGAKVTAAAIVCATHVPLNRLFLHTKLVHKQSYVVAFKGLPVEEALYFDTCDPYHYLRAATLAGEDYLIIGGEDHKTGTEDHTQISFERLLVWARERFGTERPDFHWSAQVVESIDGLPYLGRNSATKHVYVLTGFGGNGFTFGTVGALLVSDLILGKESPWADLYAATRVKASAVGAFVRENKDVPVHLIGDRLERPEVSSVDQIECDQGRTLKQRGERLAVYRDRAGALHSVSAVCTHMGCLVHFNEAERSWDCPCHGSRFDVDGGVLDGPALQPLAPVVLDEHDAAAATGKRGDNRS